MGILGDDSEMAGLSVLFLLVETVGLGLVEDAGACIGLDSVFFLLEYTCIGRE